MHTVYVMGIPLFTLFYIAHFVAAQSLTQSTGSNFLVLQTYSGAHSVQYVVSLMTFDQNVVSLGQLGQDHVLSLLLTTTSVNGTVIWSKTYTTTNFTCACNSYALELIQCAN